MEPIIQAPFREQYVRYHFRKQKHGLNNPPDSCWGHMNDSLSHGTGCYISNTSTEDNMLDFVFPLYQTKTNHSKENVTIHYKLVSVITV